jgi:hypothetical protein|tara:strand:+ start:3347 stop:3712 length:366 start_codon:yes stop_codon:yes gene_type:complete
MPDYIQDPNNSKKQIPGPKTDQHFDRFGQLVPYSMSKAPHYVQVNAAITAGLGFFFGSSASFVAKDSATGYHTSASSDYIRFDTLAAGQYHMNPIAISGSAADVAKITFVYKGGLDGLGRP